MKQSLIKLIALSIFLITTRISAQYPTDSAQISLLTLTPGAETYAAFGHSAIRVFDPKQGFDYVYNYGTFDFSTPNFYPKFLFGKLLYSLSVSNYRDFYEAYQSWGQGMWEQPLNLTSKEKWQLISNLQENYRQENRYYRYAFFRDNCSTRIRDIVEKSVDGTVTYDSSLVVKDQSFRQLFTAYLDFREPWALFGMDIMMGKRTDSIAALKDYMFLPQNLMNLWASARVVTKDSAKLLTQKPILLYPSTISFAKLSLWTSPVSVCWALFIIVLIFTYIGYRKKFYFKWFDLLLFLVTGLLGLLLTVLMTYSLHTELFKNFNAVWANPINLIFAVGIFIKRKPRWLLYLMRAYGILLILFIPLSFLITQVIPAAVYPIIGMLLLRIARAQQY